MNKPMQWMAVGLMASAVMAMMTVSTCAGAAEKISVLILTGQNNHGWHTGTPIFEKVLEETGLFEVDVAQSPGPKADMSSYQPKFADYDVVVSDYNGDDWPEATQKAFEAYVKGGGGFVVVHAADNSFANWAEYNKMIGLGGWGGRNEKSGPYVYWEDGKIVRNTEKGRGGHHGAQTPYKVTNRVTDHPITKGLPIEWMHGRDELYALMRGPAENMTVLATAFSDKATNGSGREEPVLMTIDYGSGRVFHTVLGHVGANDTSDKELPAVQCEGFIVTLQRGTEWAATGKVTQKVPANFPTADKIVLRKPFNLPSLKK